MKLPAWISRMFPPKAPPEPPDPALVPHDQWDAAVRARARMGMKPWPNLPDYDYRNTKIGICDQCKITIYGCQGYSSGPEGTRCDPCRGVL
jgi:hypothetical protein